MNQFRRATSLPGNSINIAILTEAIYKFSSWNWKQVFLRKDISFVYTDIHYPSLFHSKYRKTIIFQPGVNLANTISPQLQGLISLHKGNAQGTFCAHEAKQHVNIRAPSLLLSIPCCQCEMWSLPYTLLSSTQALMHPQMQCCSHTPPLWGHRRAMRKHIGSFVQE